MELWQRNIRDSFDPLFDEYKDVGRGLEGKINGRNRSDDVQAEKW